jgi:hypothetical protein
MVYDLRVRCELLGEERVIAIYSDGRHPDTDAPSFILRPAAACVLVHQLNEAIEEAENTNSNEP